MTSGTRGGLFGSGGRFSGGTDPIMEKFNESIHFDRRMWRQDLAGSLAYAEANTKLGLLSEEEHKSIREGLLQVQAEWEAGTFEIQPGDEDIHTANERRLTELVGSVGGKLHTGRSRNDQVATDARLWTVQAEQGLIQDLKQLLQVGTELAQEKIDVLMAGYTHLQPAQPIRFSHWLLSHLFPIVRDTQRLQQLIPRANMCPLGSGALAGNAFGIDRTMLQEKLGFQGITPNSLDSVCDRDFIVEFLFWSTLLLTHISQFAEDVIVNSMLQGFVVSDFYSTGSSLMPQKKNPDALELLRAKAGVALGKLVGFSAVLKGLPRAYNKDLQEDKILLFEAYDTTKDCLAILTGVIGTLSLNEAKLKQALCPEMLATDLADYLVERGVPFRETHHIAGAVVRVAEERQIRVDELTLDDLQAIDGRFGDDIVEVWDYERSVERKRAIGGTSKSMVQAQIDTIQEFAASL